MFRESRFVGYPRVPRSHVRLKVRGAWVRFPEEPLERTQTCKRAPVRFAHFGRLIGWETASWDGEVEYKTTVEERKKNPESSHMSPSRSPPLRLSVSASRYIISITQIVAPRVFLRVTGRRRIGGTTRDAVALLANRQVSPQRAAVWSGIEMPDMCAPPTA